MHYNCIPTFAHRLISFVMGNKLLAMSNLRSFQKCFYYMQYLLYMLSLVTKSQVHSFLGLKTSWWHEGLKLLRWSMGILSIWFWKVEELTSTEKKKVEKQHYCTTPKMIIINSLVYILLVLFINRMIMYIFLYILLVDPYWVTNPVYHPRFLWPFSSFTHSVSVPPPLVTLPHWEWEEHHSVGCEIWLPE